MTTNENEPSASVGGDVELPKSLGHIVHTAYGPLYQEVRVEGSTLPSDEVCAISAAIAYADRRVAAYISSIPADWHADSSIETWFPYTAISLDSERKRADALAARVAELEVKLSALLKAAAALRFDLFELKPHVAAMFDGRPRLIVAADEREFKAFVESIKAAQRDETENSNG